MNFIHLKDKRHLIILVQWGGSELILQWSLAIIGLFTSDVIIMFRSNEFSHGSRLRVRVCEFASVQLHSTPIISTAAGEPRTRGLRLRSIVLSTVAVWCQRTPAERNGVRRYQVPREYKNFIMRLDDPDRHIRNICDRERPPPTASLNYTPLLDSFVTIIF